MKTSLTQILFITIALFLFGCGEKSKDDKIEESALPLYEKFLNEKSFCKAFEITQKRFEYVYDHQTSNEELNKRAIKWNARAKAVDLDCEKEKWPKKENELLLKIKRQTDNYDIYENLSKFSVAIPKDSFGRDSVDRYCAFNLAIKNNSKFTIDGFSYDANNIYQMPSDSFPISLKQDNDSKSIIPGEDRIIKVDCNLLIGSISDELKRYELPMIPLNVHAVSLSSGENIELFRYRRKEQSYNFLDEINRLKKQLIDENPNNPH